MLPALIAVDWGTTRLRAWLVSADGTVLDRTASDDGILSVPAGGFPATLLGRVGPWLERHGRLPVAMAGMVGSRNGWVEVPYVDCPAGIPRLASALTRVPLGDGIDALIVPGLITRDADGTPDVMRGEETKIAGAGLDDGGGVMPGTHGKWARLAAGVVEGFATFMTGELYAALIGSTILGRLAEEPDDPAGFARGLAAVRRPGGLTHQLFAARTLVLAGDMPGTQVRPYLSGLLVGTELDQGLALAAGRDLVLVADGAFAESYGAAFAPLGVPVRCCDPEDVFLRGLARIVAAA